MKKKETSIMIILVLAVIGVMVYLLRDRLKTFLGERVLGEEFFPPIFKGGPVGFGEKLKETEIYPKPPLPIGEITRREITCLYCGSLLEFIPYPYLPGPIMLQLTLKCPVCGKDLGIKGLSVRRYVEEEKFYAY